MEAKAFATICDALSASAGASQSRCAMLRRFVRLLGQKAFKTFLKQAAKRAFSRG
jgi:hypothetical protein